MALIVAMDRNRVIGVRNTLPWRLPDDQRRFRAITRGHTVILGRKTYESIGRPLPGRRNVVVTRQAGYAAPGAEVVHSLAEALARARAAGDEGPFVIGGAELYAQALPLARWLYVTHVETAVADGDTRFPEIDPGEWVAQSREAHPADARHAFPFSYVDYRRRSAAPASGCVRSCAAGG